MAVIATRSDAKLETIEQIIPGVWFRQGDLDQNGHCNNIVIEMKDYLIVVDANYPSGARATMAEIIRYRPELASSARGAGEARRILPSAATGPPRDAGGGVNTASGHQSPTRARRGRCRTPAKPLPIRGDSSQQAAEDAVYSVVIAVADTHPSRMGQIWPRETRTSSIAKIHDPI